MKRIILALLFLFVISNVSGTSYPSIPYNCDADYPINCGGFKLAMEENNLRVLVRLNSHQATTINKTTINKVYYEGNSVSCNTPLEVINGLGISELNCSFPYSPESEIARVELVYDFEVNGTEEQGNLALSSYIEDLSESQMDAIEEKESEGALVQKSIIGLVLLAILGGLIFLVKNTRSSQLRFSKRAIISWGFALVLTALLFLGVVKYLTDSAIVLILLLAFAILPLFELVQVVMAIKKKEKGKLLLLASLLTMVHLIFVFILLALYFGPL